MTKEQYIVQKAKNGLDQSILVLRLAENSVKDSWISAEIDTMIMSLESIAEDLNGFEN